MATFEVEHSEGMRWIRVDLVDDDVRTKRGALNHLRGDVALDVPWPSLQSWWVSLFSDESLLRPRYSGTGTVYLDSTLGGYHLMQVKPGERWILDRHCFWASDGEVRLVVHREPVLTAVWAGQGLIWYKTALVGDGQVALSVDGPVEEMTLENDRLVTDGLFVIARTEGIRLRIRRPGRSVLSSWLSGQQRVYSYEGTGRLLLCTVPFWRARLQAARDAAAIE